MSKEDNPHSGALDNYSLQCVQDFSQPSPFSTWTMPDSQKTKHTDTGRHRQTKTHMIYDLVDGVLQLPWLSSKNGLTTSPKVLTGQYEEDFFGLIGELLFHKLIYKHKYTDAPSVNTVLLTTYTKPDIIDW